jgi:hypothetical protein
VQLAGRKCLIAGGVLGRDAIDEATMESIPPFSIANAPSRSWATIGST